MKKDYQVTYGYRAVISISIKAETEDEAIKLATESIVKMKAKISSIKDLNIEDDSYNPLSDGILDMTATWGLL